MTRSAQFRKYYTNETTEGKKRKKKAQQLRGLSPHRSAGSWKKQKQELGSQGL